MKGRTDHLQLQKWALRWVRRANDMDVYLEYALEGMGMPAAELQPDYAMLDVLLDQVVRHCASLAPEQRWLSMKLVSGVNGAELSLFAPGKYSGLDRLDVQRQAESFQIKVKLQSGADADPLPPVEPKHKQ